MAETMGKCPYAARCGGCQYQGMEYQKQLEMKQENIRRLLREAGRPEPIIGMENPYHYRNKVHAVYRRLRSGEIVAGTYQEGTHRVVAVENCQIEDPEAGKVIQTIRRLLKSFRIKIYNEDTGYGLFRHVLIRTGRKTGQMLVVLVAASPVFPSKNNFVKALKKEHPSITSVVLNVNDRNTSMVLGDRNITLSGKGFIEDELCGLRFRISPSSFYQVNPVQTEILYGKAMELAQLTGRERVIDAYCGIGTIGLIAAKKAGQVIGVELNRDAVRDAVDNCKRNGIRNTRFIARDAGEFLTAMAAAGEKADVVFMDPPRSGSSRAFLDSLKILAPERIVYISCGPETLARDLKTLAGSYRAAKIQPVDMFPFTGHTEVVVQLMRRG